MGDEECVCGRPRCLAGVCKDLFHLPFPVSERENYKSFEELYGKDKNESEKYVPSCSEAAAKRHRMPFSPSAQKAKNVKIVVQCSECRKWRVCHTERVFKGAKSNNWSRNWKACPSHVARIFKILKIVASTMLSC